MGYRVEHTDTFAGEANYAWVKRFDITDQELGTDDPTRLQIIRRAKALTGLAGVRCSVIDHGEGWIITPRALNQVVFVDYLDQA